MRNHGVCAVQIPPKGIKPTLQCKTKFPPKPARGRLLAKSPAEIFSLIPGKPGGRPPRLLVAPPTQAGFIQTQVLLVQLLDFPTYPEGELVMRLLCFRLDVGPPGAGRRDVEHSRPAGERVVEFLLASA